MIQHLERAVENARMVIMENSVNSVAQSSQFLKVWMEKLIQKLEKAFGVVCEL